MYAHQGRFEYDARVPRSAAYPDGQVSTGEPVFQRLVHRLRVNFTYRLESELPSPRADESRSTPRSATAEAGSAPAARRRARVRTAQATVSGVLDLDQLQRITDEVRDLTGSAQTAYTVAVLPRVDVAGDVGGETVDADFRARTFLRRRRSAAAAEPRGRRGRRPVRAPRARHRHPRRRRPRSRSARSRSRCRPLGRVSLLGIAALLLLGGWRSQPDAAVMTATSTRGSRPATGPLLLPVSSRSGDWEHVIELADMAGARRGSREHQGKLILQVSDGERAALTSSRTGAPRTATACTRRSRSTAIVRPPRRPRPPRAPMSP